MASASIVMTKNEIPERLRLLVPKVNRGVQGIMAYYAPQVESYARKNAPWKDQTGNARNGLFAETFKIASNHGITLFHSMPYGIWLEVKWSGRYAIIVPTIERMSPKVMGAVQKLLARI